MERRPVSGARERPAGRVGAGRLAAVGLLTGLAVGAAEITFIILRNQEPSVLRRSEGLIAYGAILYGTLFALLFLAAGGLLRLGGLRGWRAAMGSGRALLAGFTVGIVAGSVCIAEGEFFLFWAPLPARLAVLAFSLAVAAGAGWLAARLLARRGGGWLDRALGLFGPRVLVPSALVVLALVGGVYLLKLRGGPGRESTPPGGRPVARTASGAQTKPPNILLVVVDTLRADGLGCYGGTKGGTPAADRLASEGVLFEEVTAGCSWTLPSVASILTSTDPGEHGLVDFDGNVPSDLGWLPEHLSRQGYRCTGIIGNPLMSVGRGFERGFDLYDVYDYSLEAQLAASRVFSGVCRLSGLLGDMLREHHAILWLQGSPPFITTRLSFDVYDEELNDRLFRFADLGGGAPQFLYVQYVAPHTPYLPHPVGIIKSQPAFTPENSTLLKGLYDGEVEYTDRVFADLMERLERTGFLKDAIVVFTSDHGEEFKEHGRWKHGHTLYQQGLRVPVIIKAPGLPADRRIKRRVSLLDIAPTLLDLAGLPVLPSCRGRSLKSLALGEADDIQPREIFSDVASRHLNPNHNLFSITQDDWKIIRRRRTSGELVSEEMYRLDADPMERRRLVPEAAGGVGEELRARLDEFERTRRERRGQSISDEEMQRLRALGYVR